MAVTEEALARKLQVVLPLLNERQRRALLAAEAQAWGRGGISLVARTAGVSATTVRKGLAEIAQDAEPSGRARRPGGGRKPLTYTDPELLAALKRLVDPATRGDRTSPLRWTSKSTRTLADELGEQGHRIGYRSVAKLLRQMGYRLQAARKTKEGKQHPDRDAQFGYLADQARDHLDAGDPVISVDTKKKEKVGEFANGGREYQPKGQPEQAGVHDFPSLAEGKAIPYGVCDVAEDSGWVSVGVDHDTAAFAVAAIRRWWQQMGRDRYPHSRRLLISADGGGSNSSRSRTWKVELGKLAAETGLEITVGHLPPGTSKWNKIEHRLFAHISMNWRGRPLVSHEVVVETIAATTTRQGLTVHAELDRGDYPTGVKVSDSDLAAVPKRAHEFHPEWNYTLLPEAP